MASTANKLNFRGCSCMSFLRGTSCTQPLCTGWHMYPLLVCFYSLKNMFVFSPVGFKGNLSLLEICSHFYGGHTSKWTSTCRFLLFRWEGEAASICGNRLRTTLCCWAELLQRRHIPGSGILLQGSLYFYFASFERHRSQSKNRVDEGEYGIIPTIDGCSCRFNSLPSFG